MNKHFLEQFEEIVKRYGSNTAIEVDGVGVSYKSVVEKAKKLGQELSAAGIGTEDVVALSFEKSAEYIIAFLGAWYAGAAFVPVPPSLPEKRRAYIVNDIEPDAIVSYVDDEFKVDVLQSKVLSACKDKHSTKDLAYVYYTSGSTGAPKGVLVTHAGIVNILEEQIKTFGINETSRCFFLLSINFDASFSDMGTALLSGATLCIETMSKQELTAQLFDVLEEKEITHIDLPPSLLEIYDPQDKPEHLQTIVIGGETCSPETVCAWAHCCRVVNVYGPTETTICTSMKVCDPSCWNGFNIGHPVKCVDYIVDEYGELLIGGDCVARGYHKKDDLTRERFIQIDGDTFYRTGDLVDEKEDGFHFIGRKDRQLKIRGQLVAPEEVENQIIQHAHIARAAVLEKKNGKSTQLIACVEPKVGTTINEVELGSYLAAHLTEWMIPTRFYFVESIPSNVNGKVDKAILREMIKETKEEEDVIVYDEMTQTFIDIWKNLLGKASITPDDNFFEIGGDSLSVLELVMQLKKNGILIPIGLLSEKQTIRELVREVHSQHGKTPTDGMLTKDLKKDVVLPKWLKHQLQKNRSLPKSKHGHILITGAAGFVGTYLIKELLQITTKDLYLLVRGEDEVAGLKRIKDSAMHHHTDLCAADYKRLFIVNGDITKSQFGLSKKKWVNLCDSIGVVYHCAAQMNMVRSYGDLKETNVNSMYEMLRFVSTSTKKRLNYCSTLSVFVATNQNTGIALEEDHLDKTETVYGGYAQSKWVAERILHLIPKEQIDLVIYRLGLITGNSKTGIASTHDYLDMFLDGLSEIGCVPEGVHENLHVDITPVDHATKAMVHIGSGAEQGVFHIANTKGFSLKDYLDGLKEYDRGVEVVSPCEFRKRVDQMTLSQKGSASVMALCRILPEQDDFEQLRGMDLFQGTDITFDQTQTKKALQDSRIAIPKVSKQLFNTYMNAYVCR